MKTHKTIIVVDDNRGVLSAVELLLKNYFDKIILLNSPNTLISTIQSVHPDVVLLDMNFNGGINNGNEGLYWLHEIKHVRPQLPVVLFTAYADIDLAVKGIKDGAIDFIVKPWDNNRLVETLQAAIKPTEKKTAKTKAQPNAIYWGESTAMAKLKLLIEKVAVTDANILITGENGTGKEVLAREIHRLSSRASHEMVAVDMGAITETLFESELFGHKKGAFTDAHADRAGKFEIANQSTLFLDEIGNLPFHLQAKLLTVLQRRSVVRVGDNESLPVDIRLICATNCNLEEMVVQDRFRQDLLYRINTIHIEIPPLRERKEDIVPLAKRFIAQFNRQYGKSITALTDEAVKKLMDYSWYGNIRELEHAIEKAIIISEGDRLKADYFHLPRKAQSASSQNAEVATLEDMEKQMITVAIDQCSGNLSAVAVQLGITRQTLYNKMKKFGL